MTHPHLHSRYPSFILLAAALLLSACLQLEPKPNPASVRHYVLEPIPADSDSTAALDGPVVDLHLARFPGYLNRSGLAVRSSGHELVFAPLDRWAEDLQSAWLRALGAELHTAASIRPRRWGDAIGGPPSRVLHLRIQRMEGNTGGDAVLHIDGWIADPDGSNAESFGPWHISRSWQPGVYETLVSAHAANIRDVAQRIATLLNTP